MKHYVRNFDIVAPPENPPTSAEIDFTALEHELFEVEFCSNRLYRLQSDVSYNRLPGDQDHCKLYNSAEHHDLGISKMQQTPTAEVLENEQDRAALVGTVRSSSNCRIQQ